MTRDLGAVVLCGGKSRRMGQPKAWLPFGDGEVLLQRVTRILAGVAHSVVVVAAPDQEIPTLPNEIRIIRDPVSDRGPLQGVAAGLAAIPESADYVYASATDVPFLEPQWPLRLRDRIGDCDLAIPFIDGYHHPLAALYRRKTALPAIEELLKENRLRPIFLLEKLRAITLSAEDFQDIDPGCRTLRNLNTPEDYEQALRELTG